MTMERLEELLRELGVPVAYHHFEEADGVEPPFIVFLETSTNNFAADGIVFYSFQRMVVELYADHRNLQLERSMEQLLTSHGIFFTKNMVFLHEQRLHEVYYEFEI